MSFAQLDTFSQTGTNPRRRVLRPTIEGTRAKPATTRDKEYKRSPEAVEHDLRQWREELIADRAARNVPPLGMRTPQGVLAYVRGQQVRS